MRERRIWTFSLNELINFIKSEQFQKSEWAGDCLFPDITKNRISSHPLAVVERVSARKGAAVSGMVMLCVVLIICLIDIWIYYNDIKILVEIVLILGVVSFGILHLFFKFFLIKKDEKQVLKSCKDQWHSWEEMLGEPLAILIKRSHVSLETMVEEALVKAIKELIRIERLNTAAREKRELNSFDLNEEKEAREKVEDYHRLVRFTNIAHSDYRGYFARAERELDKKEEAERIKDNRQTAMLLHGCEGCGG